MAAKEFIQKWKSNFEYRTIVNAFLSAIITIFFAVYNGLLGIIYGAVWNGCICIYYFVLAGIRLSISLGAVRNKDADSRNKVFRRSSNLLILLNLSLIVPIVLMVLNKKIVNITMIPAISLATYTTYKIVVTSVNMKRAGRTDDKLVKLLRSINFFDAIISILTIQNTLLAVTDSAGRQDMMVLGGISSLTGFLVIMIMTIYNILKAYKR